MNEFVVCHLTLLKKKILYTGLNLKRKETRLCIEKLSSFTSQSKKRLVYDDITVKMVTMRCSMLTKDQ